MVEQVRSAAVGWGLELGVWGARVADVFSRSEPRALLEQMTLGLLSDLGRKNSWTLAAAGGHAGPGRFQTFLCRSTWDPAVLVSRVAEMVDEELGGPGAVLVIDDTQIVKKGTKSAGVAPQHCGATNQIENCQVVVLSALAGALGSHAFVGERLYLPRRWTDDRARLREAGVPEGTVFRTKNELAIELVDQALDQNLRFSWVAIDGGYGQYSQVREHLVGKRLAYVAAVRSNQTLAPVPRIGAQAGIATARDHLPRVTSWETRSCGHGSKGERFYDWAIRTIALPDGEEPAEGFEHLLIIRRTTTPTGDDAKDVDYFIAHAPIGTPPGELIRVAGTRWRIEECNQQVKSLAGLDQHQVRTWISTHRIIAVSIYAHAFAATRHARLHQDAPTQPTDPDPA